MTTPRRWFEIAVPREWLDHNGHMNEARYLEAFSRASDAWMEAAGLDADRLASGRGFFTVETHLRHLGEARLGEAIHVEARILAREGKRVRAFQTLRRDADGAALATAEQMFVHVDLTTRRAVEPAPGIAAALDAMVAKGTGRPWPEGAGRAIGDPRPRAGDGS